MVPSGYSRAPGGGRPPREMRRPTFESAPSIGGVMSRSVWARQGGRKSKHPPAHAASWALTEATASTRRASRLC